MPVGDSVKERRKQNLQIVRQMMQQATVLGRKVRLSEIQAACGCSKPTAMTLKRAIEAEVGADGASTALVVKSAERAAVKATAPRPMPRHPGNDVQRDTMIATGIDMVGELQNSITNLKELADDVASDLRHGRYFVLGCPPAHEFPGLCRRCGELEIGKLEVTSRPTGLMVNYGDLATLAGQAIKAQASIAKVVDTYNGVLSQFYHYGAMEAYMANVRLAIMTVVPEHAKAIASELRRLQLAAGHVASSG